MINFMHIVVFYTEISIRLPAKWSELFKVPHISFSISLLYLSKGEHAMNSIFLYKTGVNMTHSYHTWKLVKHVSISKSGAAAWEGLNRVDYPPKDALTRWSSKFHSGVRNHVEFYLVTPAVITEVASLSLRCTFNISFKHLPLRHASVALLLRGCSK